jgi:hypothetical protein
MVLAVATSRVAQKTEEEVVVEGAEVVAEAPAEE